MYVHLWKWEVYTFFRKDLVQACIYVEIYVPEIGTVHPYPDHNVYRTVGQLLDLDSIIGLAKYPRVFVENLADDFLCNIEIVAVVYADNPFHASCFLCRCIHDDAGGYRAVGENDGSVVRRGKYGIEQLD